MIPHFSFFCKFYFSDNAKTAYHIGFDGFNAPNKGRLPPHPHGQHPDEPPESLRRGLLGAATRGGDQLAAQL